MSVYVAPSAVNLFREGYYVTKAAQTPPNSGSSATLYTVAGGAVLITGLFGRVSTALNGTTGAIALGTAPTTGTANTTGIATAGVVGGAEIGTWVGVAQASAGLAAALVVGSSKQAGAAVFMGQPFFPAYTGTLTITTSVATMTGAIDWYLFYVPVTQGATVS